MSLKIIDGKDIEKNLSDKITVLSFYADWCGPCKMMAPIFEKLAQQPNTQVLKVNIDSNKDVAKKYGVQGIPTMLIFYNKKLKGTESGYIPFEVLKEKIEKVAK